MAARSYLNRIAVPLAAGEARLFAPARPSGYEAPPAVVDETPRAGAPAGREPARRRFATAPAHGPREEREAARDDAAASTASSPTFDAPIGFDAETAPVPFATVAPLATSTPIARPETESVDATETRASSLEIATGQASQPRTGEQRREPPPDPAAFRDESAREGERSGLVAEPIDGVPARITPDTRHDAPQAPLEPPPASTSRPVQPSPPGSTSLSVPPLQDVPERNAPVRAQNATQESHARIHIGTVEVRSVSRPTPPPSAPPLPAPVPAPPRAPAGRAGEPLARSLVSRYGLVQS